METEPTIEDLELVHGPTGAWLDSDDEEALAEALRRRAKREADAS